MDANSLNSRVIKALIQVVNHGKPVSVKHGSVELIVTGGKYYPRLDELIGKNDTQPRLKKSTKVNVELTS